MCPVFFMHKNHLRSSQMSAFQAAPWNAVRVKLSKLPGRATTGLHATQICNMSVSTCYIILHHSISFYILNGTDGLSPLILTGLQFFDSSRSKERSLSVYLCLRNRHSPRIARRPKAAQFKIPLRIRDQLAGGTVVGRGGIQARHPHTHLIHGTSGNTSGTLNGDPPHRGAPRNLTFYWEDVFPHGWQWDLIEFLQVVAGREDAWRIVEKMKWEMRVAGFNTRDRFHLQLM